MDKKVSPFVSKHDRPQLLDCRNRYDVLRDFINGLSTKLSSVSSNIEHEFLSAYRVHMLSVQQDLRDLKNQVIKAEEAVNEDRQVATLEQEVTWFSDEALRLKNQTASMKKDMQHVVVRTKALREQREFLSEQLKSMLKRSRILEAELKELTGNTFENENASSIATPSVAHSQQQRMMATSASAPALQRTADSRGRNMANSSSTPKLFPKIKSKKSQSSSSLMAVDDVLIPKPKMTSANFKPAALSACDKLEQLKASRASTEADLEHAIRGVLKEIVDRKLTVAARDMRLSLEEAKQAKPKLAGVGGITGLGLEHFSDSDRLSAISIYLSQPGTFRQVVDYLVRNC